VGAGVSCEVVGVSTSEVNYEPSLFFNTTVHTSAQVLFKPTFFWCLSYSGTIFSRDSFYFSITPTYVHIFQRAGDLNQSPNLNVLFNYALAQLHLNQRAEAFEGFVYVASLATPDHLLFEASWAAGLVALQVRDIYTTLVGEWVGSEGGHSR